MPTRKKFLFVLRHPPHGSMNAQESLDMILAAAAFDQSVSLLFLDDGVFQLKRGQYPEAIGFKQIAPIFDALELYDVEEIWVERESLQQRGLARDGLILPVRLVSRDEVADLLSSQDVLVSC